MKNCPYCGKECGEVAVTYEHDNKMLHYCPSCNALEIGEGDDTSHLTEDEAAKGWELLGGQPSEPGF